MIALMPAAEVAPVPQAWWRWQQEAKEYAAKRAKESLSKRHIQEITRVLDQVGDLLKRADLSCHPRLFDDTRLDSLLNGPWRPASEEHPGLAAATRKYNVCLLNGFLKAYGNLTIERRRLRFPNSPVRPLLALTEDQARRLLSMAAERGISTHAVVALELLMGLRRSEVLRLRLSDLGEKYLQIHGKGRQGGKTRLLVYHDEVRRILPELVAHRVQVAASTRGPDSGYLFVHRSGSVLRVWSKAYVDRRLVGPAFAAAGVHTPGNLNHALRRTCARTLWLHGVPIEKVAYVLGHADTRTTRRYLALNLDDIESAIAVLNKVFPAGAG